MASNMVPVGIVGAEGRNALEVAAVSLTAKGMNPMRTPCQMSGRIDQMQTIFHPCHGVCVIGSPSYLCWCGRLGDLNAHVWPVDRLRGEIQEDEGVALALQHG
jgi:hypothetical protein